MSRDSSVLDVERLTVLAIKQMINSECRGQDFNLHCDFGNQALNPP
jgi:hypothetical protein